MTRPEWMADAACQWDDPEVFFDGDHGGYDPVNANVRWRQQARADALAICARCLAKTDCLDYALTTTIGSRDRPIEGIWGGTTTTQRRAIIRKQEAS